MVVTGKNLTMSDSCGVKNETVFWKQGFKILQNIDDRMTLSSQVKRARDPITLKIGRKS